MDTSRNSMLGELAGDAAMERADFLVQATDQFRKFLEANRARIEELGGLTLIDEEPDYLSIAPDLTFRSRTRFEDPDTGEWVSETEVIETPAEIIELYNPADLYASFGEAAKEAAGVEGEPTATDELLDTAGIAPEDTFGLSDDEAYARAADDWAAAQNVVLDADSEQGAAQRIYDLALEFQERSQRSEARLIEQFEESVQRLSGRHGDLIVVDDDDERLTLASDGHFKAEVLPEDSEGEWRTLSAPEAIVEYYDPTDVFGDLADALAEAYPAIAPEVPGEPGEDAAEEAFGDEDDIAAEDESGQNGSRP
jgi:hypothetical protein